MQPPPVCRGGTCRICTTAPGPASRIFFDCRRKGVTVRSTIDCLIAALVLEGKATLPHDDDDVEQIRKVRPLATLRA
jgi:hypothetical protein